MMDPVSMYVTLGKGANSLFRVDMNSFDLSDAWGDQTLDMFLPFEITLTLDPGTYAFSAYACSGNNGLFSPYQGLSFDACLSLPISGDVVVPEPASMALLLLGVSGLVCRRGMRRR